MPTYSISAPDGKTYEITGPAGASQQDVQNEVLRQYPQAAGSPAAAPPPQLSGIDTAMSILNRIGRGVASAGPLETAVHLGSGTVAGLGGGLGYLSQLATTGGDVNSAKQFQERVQNDLTYKPRTEAGKAMASAADTALGLIPQGLNKAGEVTADVTGSPLAGAAVNTGGNALIQLLGLRSLRGARGAAGAAEEAAASVPRPAPTTPAELLQQSLGNGKDVGYQTTPNYDPQASFLDRLGQGIAGKVQLEQGARVQNQGVTNALGARAVGMDPAALVTQEALQHIRQGAVDRGYEPIKELEGDIPVDTQFLRNNAAIKSAHGNKLSGNPDVVATADFLLNPNSVRAAPRGGVSTRVVPDAGDTLIPQAEDSLLGSLGNASPRGATKPVTTGPSGSGGTLDPLTLTPKMPSFDPATLLDHISTLRSRASDAFAAGRADAGTAFRKQAGELEALLDRHLQDLDNVPRDMLTNYRAARQLIAKTHNVGDNLNPSTGNIDASGMGKLLKDQTPLTGDLKVIADFANSAPGIAGIPNGAPLPTSPFNTLAGAAAAHGTGGASLALIPAARAFAAKWLLRHNENPALLQPLDKTLGQTALDAVHGNATAFGKIYGNTAPGTLVSTREQK